MDKNLVSNLKSNFLISTLNFSYPFYIFYLISKDLGIEEYGYYSSLVSFISIFIVAAELGLNNCLTGLVSNKDKKKLNVYFGSFLVIKLVFILVTIIPIWFIYIYSFDTGIYMFLTLLMFYVCSTLTPVWYYYGTENIKKFMDINIVSKVFGIILLTILLYLDRTSIYSLVLLQSFMALILFMYSVINVRKNGYQPEFCTKDVKFLLKKSSVFYFSRIGMSVYEMGAVYFSSRILSGSEVGIFSFLMQIYRSGAMFIGTVSSVIFPYINRTKNILILNKIIFLFLSVWTIFLLFIPNIAQFATVTLFQNMPLDNSLIYIVYVMLLLQFISSVIGYPYLISFGYENLAHGTMSLCSISYFLLSLGIVLFGITDIKPFMLLLLVPLFLVSISRVIIFYIKSKRCQ